MNMHSLLPEVVKPVGTKSQEKLKKFCKASLTCWYWFAIKVDKQRSRSEEAPKLNTVNEICIQVFSTFSLKIYKESVESASTLNLPNKSYT